MKYYIIAGEPSGGMHGANMMKQLKLRDPEAYFRVWGGDCMAEEAQELAKHIRETSFMGLFAVLWHLRTIRRNFRYCEADLLAFKPDVLILIDNSGFNLRIAGFVKKSALKTRIFYYILPQAWAWKRQRVHTIQHLTDRCFAILPFEQDFYKSYGYDLDYVGHPILDSLQKRKEELLSPRDFRQRHNLDERPIIALLPGSRKREVRTKLPIMMRVVSHFPDFRFVVAGTKNIDEAFYHKYIRGGGVRLIFGHTYDILNNATAALVTSGTATLETALFRVPQVVCYKPGWLTFQVLRHIVSIKYICMVNLILGRKVVEELVEGRLNERQLVHELGLLLQDATRERLKADYDELERKLGGPGASERVADLMIEALRL